MRVMSLPSVGIVGTPDHIRLLTPILKSEGFSVKAVWCKSHEMAQELADQFSIAHCTTSFHDLLLLHDVDMVYVATEPVMQAEVAVKALTSGKHCVCAKPPSVSATESEKMLRLARYYSQLQCLVECHARYMPVFVELRRLLMAGDIGNLLSIDVQVHMDSLYGAEAEYSWRCDPSVGGGVLNIVGSHIVEVVCYLEGRSCPIQGVHCCLKTLCTKTKSMSGFRTIESDDFCSLQLDTVGGVHTSVLINSNCSHTYSFVFNACGSRGRAVVRGWDLYLQRQGEMEEQLVHKDFQSDSLKWSDQWGHGKVLGCTGMIRAIKHHFLVDSQQQDDTVSSSDLTSFEDGHHIRSVLDCARLSSKLGRYVTIPELGSSSTDVPFWTSGSKTDVEKGAPVKFPVSTV